MVIYSGKGPWRMCCLFWVSKERLLKEISKILQTTKNKIYWYSALKEEKQKYLNRQQIKKTEKNEYISLIK